MKNAILGDECVSYVLKRSKRRSISASVNNDGVLEVRAPVWMSDTAVAEFLESKSDRIIQMIRGSRRIREYEKELGTEGLAKLKELARDVIPGRVEYFSKIMGVIPAKVKIGSAKKRYGSCSSSGNLNFSCRVMAYSANAVDYVVIHELAHLIHMNHSAAFWRTVEKFMPDYKTAREELRHIPE